MSVHRRHKYGAQPTVVDGIRFASKAEARRYQELKLLEKAGAIRDLELQPRFPLLAWVRSTKHAALVGYFVADFSYTDTMTMESIVEDVKGMKTLPLSRWKQRHLLVQCGIRVREVR